MTYRLSPVLFALVVAGLIGGGPDDAYAQSGTVEGTVVHAETDAPLSDVNVVVREEGEVPRREDGPVGTSTDGEGRYRLGGLPPGTYRVQATAVGFMPSEKPVEVRAGQTQTVRFALMPQAYELNEIVVQGRGARETRATTVQRVEAAAIQQQDAADVSELAQLIPATHVATNSRGQTILYLRNAGDRQVGQFFDGALLNVPWDNRVDISLFPSSVVGEVTAAKGVVPVQYGTNVIGGAINFQSRTLEQAGQHTDVSAQVGTAAHRQGALTHLGRTARWDYTAALQYTERGNMPLPGEADVPFSQPLSDRRVNTDRQLLSGFARASYRFDGAGQLALTAMQVDAEQGIAPESNLNPARASVRYWRYPRWQKSVLIASGRTALGTRTAVRGAAWGSRFAQDIHQYQTVAYRALDEMQEDRDVTGGVRLVATQDLPAGTLVVAANGLTTRHRQTNTLFDRGEPQPDSTSSFRQHIFSLGGTYDIDIAPRLTASAGLSFDGTATPDTGPFPERDPFYAVGVTSGLSYQLNDTYRLRASAGRKGRFPTMRELYGGALGKFVPNPGLSPVTAWIGEVGVERRGAGLSGSATVFLNRVTDAIDQRTFQQGPNAGKEQRINLGGSRVYGVETTARWPVTSALLFDGHLTWMRPRGTNEGDTQPLEEKPEWLGTGSLTYTLPGGLTLMAQGQYTAGTQARTEQNTYVTLPTSLILDARVGYSVGQWVPEVTEGELFVRVDNMLDEARYYQLGLPGAGRLFRAGLSLSF
ncbi:MAG: TonB-dependent receptor [Bacteroidetes bacterium]|jgi:iron complex outermembrane receptor protein|nr:TonB-dependent receptor [Bacteroidota bacterium]